MFRFSTSLLTLTVLTGCAEGMCGNRVLDTVASPDGKYAAVIFERDCGATTRASTQVSILPSGEAPSGVGNIFIAETGAASGGDPSGLEVEAAWLGPNRLRIRYSRNANIFRRVRERKSVQVEYGANGSEN
ncbi:MAG: hypothetical protein ACREMY_26580 [bacterium]